MQIQQHLFQSADQRLARRIDILKWIGAEQHAVARDNIGEFDGEGVHRRRYFIFHQEHGVQLHGGMCDAQRFAQAVGACLIERLEHQQHVDIRGCAQPTLGGRTEHEHSDKIGLERGLGGLDENVDAAFNICRQFAFDWHAILLIDGAI